MSVPRHISLQCFTAPPPVPLLEQLALLQERSYAAEGVRSWSSTEIEALMRIPANRLFVASLDNGAPAGFLLVTFIIEEAEVLALAVDPLQQRQGVASRLIHAIGSAEESDTINRLILEVAENNNSALSLYNSLGFMEIGVRRNYYSVNGRKVAARVMEMRYAGA